MHSSRLAAALVLLFCLSPAAAAAPRLTIVAAENFYADVAGQLAGGRAEVTSVLSNPDQDPHLFEASPAVARALAAARIAVANGADYDPWMAKLLAATPEAGRRVIVVADLVGARAGDNPHLWYDPRTMPAYARALSAALAATDPANQAEYGRLLQRFTASLAPLQARVAALRARYAGVAVTATEPVFGDMAATLGLVMRNQRFQLAVMNDTEPAAGDVAAFETDLRQHRVRLLIYNSQASDAAAQRLLAIARAAGIPVLGVTETEPAGRSYQHWMLATLDGLDAALAGKPH